MPKELIKKQTITKYKVPKKYKVYMYNDDYTTMEFVVRVLMEIFDKNEAEAEHIMLTIHKSVKAVVGVYTKDIAFTKVNKATTLARAEGFPLKIEAVDE